MEMRQVTEACGQKVRWDEKWSRPQEDRLVWQGGEVCAAAVGQRVGGRAGWRAWVLGRAVEDERGGERAVYRALVAVFALTFGAVLAGGAVKTLALLAVPLLVVAMAVLSVTCNP